MQTIAVIDFETTGLSPGLGARPTEVAAVLIRGDGIVDRYHSLMNPGVPIPGFIEALTGITNAMLRGAPPVAKVMQEVADFVGGMPMAAHNASFDGKFWDSELERIRRKRPTKFACSMLLARRVFPGAPNHRLDTLVQHLRLPVGQHHRALSDAEMAARLLLEIRKVVMQRYDLSDVPHDLLLALQRAPRHRMDACVEAFFRSAARRSRCQPSRDEPVGRSR